MAYYLIPFETDKEKIKYKIQPKYLSELGTAKGLQPSKIDGKWLQNYYVVRSYSKETDELLLKKPDVIALNANTDKTKLSSLDIDVSKISDISPTYEQVDTAITMWLIGEEKILSNIVK